MENNKYIFRNVARLVILFCFVILCVVWSGNIDFNKKTGISTFIAVLFAFAVAMLYMNRRVRIGKISVDPNSNVKPVYTRKDGSFWLKLNDEQHIKTMLSPNSKDWVQIGLEPEKFDPKEKVSLVQ